MEELAWTKKRNTKRRLMESQVGAEVRRIHVIYFLSRKGCIEHPHLIRVHHLSRNGVHLRDVKRWLAELRGKDMPESFAWSYKRRYKNGNVWQDLLDEDLITPISDNEYILKGSEISSACSKDDSQSDKQSPKTEDILQEEEGAEDAKHSPTPSSMEGKHYQHHQETKMDEPTKTSSEITEESLSFGSEKSTLTDDSMKLEEDKHSEDQFKEEKHEENNKIEDHSFCSKPSKKKNKKGNNVNMEEKISTPASVSSTSPSAQSATFSRSKSYSNGASLLFRNLLTCRAVDTNDSAVVTISKRNKPSLNMNLSFSKQNHHSTELTKGDKLGGSQRVFGTALNQIPQFAARRSFDAARSSAKNKSEFSNQKATTPHKPINGPQCSQCGKPFNPEKLHAHMKSCKGMKTLAKGNSPAISATSTEAASKRSSEFPFDNNPVSGYYLTHRE